MTSDVVLTAALRNNLLSLQSTQSLIDTTQFRLATGRKVNSALDNPQNFFAAQSLNNRASDLTRLLDGIGQNIQVIKAADIGVTALTTLVEQADSVAQSARDALAQGTSEAKVTGDRDLRGIDDLTTLSGLDGGDVYTVTLSITDEDGQAEAIGAFGAASGANVSITIAANDSIDDLINTINDINLDDGAGQAEGGQAFEASLNESGFLEIRTLNGGNFNIDFVDTTTDADTENLGIANALGFGQIARIVEDGAGANNVELTSIANVSLTSFQFFRTVGGAQETAVRSTTLDNLVDGTGLNNYFGNLDDAADDYTLSVNGGTTVNINLTDTATGNPLTVQDFIDQINDSDVLNEFISAGFDDATGQVVITPISAEVQSIEIGVTSGAAADASFGFGLKDSDPFGGTALAAAGGNAERETIQLAAAAAQLAELEVEYDNIRDQIDQLVTNGDTGYRGTNLLLGDNLKTFFNEDRTSSLTTEGTTFTADGLGLNLANFTRETAVDNALTEVRAALERVRAFGTTLANDLNIIQTRETFTQSTINTLTEGLDKLTIADQNEEGAKLLALQTRQQLGVTSLALASQSQQSILRLF